MMTPEKSEGRARTFYTTSKMQTHQATSMQRRAQPAAMRSAAARPALRRSARGQLVVRAAIDKTALVEAYKELLTYIKSRNSNPIIVRLAWHDSGTYDASEKAPWPAAGGANASIRFKPEINHGANAGLQIAINLLNPIKKKYPSVSYADLFQMASAAAVEAAGGPRIDMLYGRKDVESPEQTAKEGNLPGAAPPFHDGSKTPADHLRKIFYRMGFNDQEIVALSGGHTLGRARPTRSGFGTEEGTKYTAKGTPLATPGTPGGTSWTADWLTFNNSYFTEVKAKRDKDLLVLPTDAVIFEDEGFKPFAEKYAADQAAFFADYAKAHKKLSELGAGWEEGGPVSIAAELASVGAKA